MSKNTFGGGNSPEDLKRDYGISFSRHNKYPKLVSFKYDQVDAHSHRAQKIVRECRGLILDEKMNWKVVAYPFERFFNYGESVADNLDWDSTVVYEKVDGSLAILYHYKNEWHVSTSGTADAGGSVGLTNKTFKDLFWETLGAQVGWEWLTRMLNRLPQDYTFMFELCSIDNRIVVIHDTPHVVLLGARNRVTWQELRPGEVVHYFPNTSIPNVFPVNHPKDAFPLMESMKGVEQEGFVFVDESFNRFKMKCPDYTALHHLASGLESMRLVFQTVIMREETAEVAAVFPQYADLLWEADKKYHDLIHELEALYEEHKDIEDQKEFALKVKDSTCAGAMFALRAGKVDSVKAFIRFNWHINNLLKVLGYK